MFTPYRLHNNGFRSKYSSLLIGWTLTEDKTILHISVYDEYQSVYRRARVVWEWELELDVGQTREGSSRVFTNTYNDEIKWIDVRGDSHCPIKNIVRAVLVIITEKALLRPNRLLAWVCGQNPTRHR